MYIITNIAPSIKSLILGAVYTCTEEIIKMKKKVSAYWKAIIILVTLTVILGLSTFSTEFCDWYADNVYGIICDAVSHVTGLLPFALGEILMYIGILFVIFSVVFLIFLIFLHKKKGYRKFCSSYFKTFLMLMVCLVFVYMPSWFIPFRGSVLGKGENTQRTEFSLDEIRTLLQYAADGVNKAAEEIDINADGTVTFPPKSETYRKTVDAMNELSSEYSRLKGYYPPVKTALCSDILDRMYIGGYNYPFTMEPTHSKYLAPDWEILLDAHEYAHHKGYYKENEANFLSQLALSRSEDPFLRIGAFSDMYYYLLDSYTITTDKLWGEMLESGKLDAEKVNKMKAKERWKLSIEIFGETPELCDKYFQITEAASAIEKEIYEADSHPIDNMPAVNEAIEETADVGWETQGNILKENTYDGVTLLLLQYFEGKLY